MANPTLEQPIALDVVAVQLEIDSAIEAGDTDACIELISKLLGSEALYAARRASERCVVRFPDHKKLALLKRLADPPRVTKVVDIQRIDRRPDFAWLKAHAVDHPGEWLALSRGKLWGRADTLQGAQQMAKEAGLTERPLLYHVYQD